jgi:hypothetical protein
MSFIIYPSTSYWHNKEGGLNMIQAPMVIDNVGCEFRGQFTYFQEIIRIPGTVYLFSGNNLTYR